jgi:tetratricopeptide (TPR) repeat protein
MRERFWKFILISNLGLGIAVQYWLDNQVRHETPRDEPLYLVSGKALKSASLGFDGLLSDIYWMRTILYFGEQLEEQSRQNKKEIDLRQMPRLVPLLAITTELDPHNLAAYRFGAFFLPEIDPEKAIQFAEQGVNNNPNEWRLLQDLGFIYWRQGRFREAGETYLKGSKIEGAPQWMLLMAVAMLEKGGDDQTSRDMFRRICEVNEDKFIKIICEENRSLFQDRQNARNKRTLPNEVGRSTKQGVGGQEPDEGNQKELGMRPKEVGLRPKDLGNKQKVIGSR